MDNTCGVSDIMATLNLGTIQPGKDSLFNVAATTTQSGITFSYTYKDGRLPQGLSVQANGEICQVALRGLCGLRCGYV